MNRIRIRPLMTAAALAAALFAASSGPGRAAAPLLPLRHRHRPLAADGHGQLARDRIRLQRRPSRRRHARPAHAYRRLCLCAWRHSGVPRSTRQPTRPVADAPAAGAAGARGEAHRGCAARACSTSDIWWKPTARRGRSTRAIPAVDRINGYQLVLKAHAIARNDEDDARRETDRGRTAARDKVVDSSTFDSRRIRDSRRVLSPTLRLSTVETDLSHERIVDPASEHRADARRHHRHPPPAVPRAKDLRSPARRRTVKSRGPKSRAGLIAYPELNPKRRANQHARADRRRPARGRRGPASCGCR